MNRLKTVKTQFSALTISDILVFCLKKSKPSPWKKNYSKSDGKLRIKERGSRNQEGVRRDFTE